MRPETRPTPGPSLPRRPARPGRDCPARAGGRRRPVRGAVVVDANVPVSVISSYPRRSRCSPAGHSRRPALQEECLAELRPIRNASLKNPRGRALTRLVPPRRVCASLRRPGHGDTLAGPAVLYVSCERRGPVIRALVLALPLHVRISPPASRPGQSRKSVGLVVHGGAGGSAREDDARARGRLPRRSRARAARRARGARQGWRGADAVTAAITILEDSPLFNAGKGAVFTHDGNNELDAAIMDGRTHNAGAVAGVSTIQNPILLAQAVMENGRHVMMVGEAPRSSRRRSGIEIVDPSYFWTEERWQELQKALARRRPLRHRRRGGARPGRQPGRGHLDRRDDEQALRPRRRLADHRRRHLRRRGLRRLGTGTASSSSAGGRARHLCADGVRARPLAQAADEVVMNELVRRTATAASSRSTPGHCGRHSTRRACTAATSPRRGAPHRHVSVRTPDTLPRVATARGEPVRSLPWRFRAAVRNCSHTTAHCRDGRRAGSGSRPGRE